MGVLEDSLPNHQPCVFVEDVWHYLSPFSAHIINVGGETFPTVEHAYQAARFAPGPARDKVKAAASPWDCLEISRELRQNPALLNPDFDKTKVMEDLLRLKLVQHPHVQKILLDTGQRGLIKVFLNDYYWGTGKDGSGQNMLGKLWMKIRTELQHQA